MRLALDARSRGNRPTVEHTIQQALGELGFANPVVHGHAFLLHNRKLVGRRFCFDGVEAVWLSGERQIKIYGEEGECLRVLNLAEGQTQKAA